MRVTLTTLLDAQSELDAIATDLDRHPGTLDGVGKGLYETWRGETRGAFEETYSDWKRQSAELHAALRELHAVVGARPTGRRDGEAGRPRHGERSVRPPSVGAVSRAGRAGAAGRARTR
jgi:uncharacterized protein YukE